MTSSADVEIGDDIWITDHQHPYYGKAGKVITVGKELIGVRLNGSTSPTGIYVKVGGFVKITFHKDWHQKRADCQVRPIFKDSPKVRRADEFTMTKPAIPFQLSDSAIEWADGQRAARIDNLKKTVTFLQQEIQRLEANSVTLKVEHNAPRREYSWSGPALDPDVEKARLAETDEVWLDTDQNTVMAAVWKWLHNKEMVDAGTRAAKITDGHPWEVIVKHKDGKEETIVLSLLEMREEVIKIIDFIEDGQKKDESDDKEPEEDGGRNRRLHLTNAVWGLVEHERLLNALQEWVQAQEWYEDAGLPTFTINIHKPWWVRIDSHGVERLLSLGEREEVIDMIQGDSK